MLLDGVVEVHGHAAVEADKGTQGAIDAYDQANLCFGGEFGNRAHHRAESGGHKGAHGDGYEGYRVTTTVLHAADCADEDVGDQEADCGDEPGGQEGASCLPPLGAGRAGLSGSQG